jgi:hypothetical protein
MKGYLVLIEEPGETGGVLAALVHVRYGGVKRRRAQLTAAPREAQAQDEREPSPKKKAPRGRGAQKSEITGVPDR